MTLTVQVQEIVGGLHDLLIFIIFLKYTYSDNIEDKFAYFPKRTGRNVFENCSDSF